MKAVLVWLVAIILTLMYIGFWYISQPLGVSMSTISQGITESGGWNTTGSAQMYSLLKLSFNVGFGVIVIFVWIWALASSQTEDWRSEEFGYG